MAFKAVFFFTQGSNPPCVPSSPSGDSARRPREFLHVLQTEAPGGPLFWTITSRMFVWRKALKGRDGGTLMPKGGHGPVHDDTDCRPQGEEGLLMPIMRLGCPGRPGPPL